MTHEYIAQLRADVTARLAKFDDPLIERLIYWIQDDALWMACEEVGMRKASYCTELITPQALAKEMLATLQNAMRPA